MVEGAQTLGIFSAVLLMVAVVAWAKLLGGPALQRLDGRTEPAASKIATASQLLVLAVGLSAVAAILAVAAWIGG